MTRALALVAVLAFAACGADDDPMVEQSSSSETTTSTTTEAIDTMEEAQDAGVQSDLRNALTAAKTIAVDSAGAFLDAEGAPIDAADLAAAEPSLEFTDAEASAQAVLVVTGEEGADIVLVKVSESGTAFCIASTSEGTVTYGSSDDPSNVDTIADCIEGSW